MLFFKRLGAMLVLTSFSFAASAHASDWKLQCEASMRAPWGETKKVTFVEVTDNFGDRVWKGSEEGFLVTLKDGVFYVDSKLAPFGTSLARAVESPNIDQGPLAFSINGVTCTYRH